MRKGLALAGAVLPNSSAFAGWPATTLFQAWVSLWLWLPIRAGSAKLFGGLVPRIDRQSQICAAFLEAITMTMTLTQIKKKTCFYGGGEDCEKTWMGSLRRTDPISGETFHLACDTNTSAAASLVCKHDPVLMGCRVQCWRTQDMVCASQLYAVPCSVGHLGWSQWMMWACVPLEIFGSILQQHITSILLYFFIYFFNSLHNSDNRKARTG